MDVRGEPIKNVTFTGISAGALRHNGRIDNLVYRHILSDLDDLVL